jgi:7-carboxy-7-deazaguanine synthase
METKLLISELFASIQGESSYAGRPCFFIRLAGCNLDCVYCDTEYARNAEDGEEYTIDEIVSKVEEAGIHMVEITGGEPLLQEGVNELCQKLLDAEFKVLIETNGSISIASLPPEVIKILDCKCPGSREADKMEFANFALLSQLDEVKFVISDREDYDYTVGIIKKYGLNYKVDNLLLSPELSHPCLSAQLAEWILEDKLDVRMQLQMHKLIWDPEERGR